MVLPPSSISQPPSLIREPTGIFISLGSNLGINTESPRDILNRAITLLRAGGDNVIATSSFWKSDAWPKETGAPDYINAVCQISPQDNDPSALLTRLQAIEAELGRQRDPLNRWSPRTLDLDLLDYNRLVIENGSFLSLPHPRIAVRDFVLLPLADVCQNWVHPVTGEKLEALLANILRNQDSNNCVRLD